MERCGQPLDAEQGRLQLGLNEEQGWTSLSLPGVPFAHSPLRPCPPLRCAGPKLGPHVCTLLAACAQLRILVGAIAVDTRQLLHCLDQRVQPWDEQRVNADRCLHMWASGREMGACNGSTRKGVCTHSMTPSLAGIRLSPSTYHSPSIHQPTSSLSTTRASGQDSLLQRPVVQAPAAAAGQAIIIGPEDQEPGHQQVRLHRRHA